MTTASGTLDVLRDRERDLAAALAEVRHLLTLLGSPRAAAAAPEPPAGPPAPRQRPAPRTEKPSGNGSGGREGRPYLRPIAEHLSRVGTSGIKQIALAIRAHDQTAGATLRDRPDLFERVDPGNRKSPWRLTDRGRAFLASPSASGSPA